MMRVLLDACVLYPSVLRGILIGCAKKGLFEPLWSERILEEWRRAANRNGIGALAGVEIALLTADWPNASVAVSPDTEQNLTLPDVNDQHVLAAAIDGAAGELLTANTGDFPTRFLGQFGIVRRHPDEFLLEQALAAPEVVSGVIDGVYGQAEFGADRRKILKRSGVPRLAKWDAR